MSTQAELFSEIEWRAQERERARPRLLAGWLAWREQHGVRLSLNRSMRGEAPWEAWTGSRDAAIEDVAENGDEATLMGYGATWARACMDLAEHQGWSLPNAMDVAGLQEEEAP